MKILIVQNKKGIGDLIIFLPFIEALAKKFEPQVYLLVKENSKALDIVEDNKYIKEIIVLDRDNQSNDGIHEGVFGINIHRATRHKGKKSYQVDKWSAGCQVIASNDDWKLFMKICRKARDTWNNNFTYTLLESKDIRHTWL